MASSLDQVQIASPVPNRGISIAPVPAVSGGIERVGPGNLVDAVFDIADVFARADKENRLAEYRADTTRRLSELRITLDEETDPIRIKERWDSGVEEIQKEYEGRLGSSSLSGPWKEHFLGLSTRLGLDVTARQRGIIVDKGRAALLSELNAEAVALKTATAPEDYLTIKQRGLGAIEAKAATGILGAEEAARQRIEWEQNVDRFAEEQERERRMQATYAALREGFPSRAAAVDFLENPRNQQQMGLSLKESLYFIDILDAEERRDREQHEAAISAARKRESDAVYSRLLTGDYAGAMGALANAKHLGDEERVRIQDSIRGREWKDDPEVVAALRKDIWAERMKSPEEVMRYIGDGLSIETAKSLREDIQKVAEAATPGNGVNYFDLAVQRFRKRYSQQPEVLEQEAKFVASLAHMARERNLSPADPALDKVADELLAPFDNFTWYKPWSWGSGDDPTVFEHHLEEGRFPHDGNSEYRRRVPAEAYAAIRAELERAGKDTSDATVYQVYVSNRAAFEGAK